MKNYSYCEIINNIKRNIPFSKTTEDGSLSVCVYNYIPLITLALNSGKKMERLYRFNLNLNEKEKENYEERFCDFFINDFPIKIIANESKLKYDLDKSLKYIIDKTLYKKPINDIQIKQLITKHKDFYEILEALITKLLKSNRLVFIYDFHTFYSDYSDKSNTLFKLETNQNGQKEILKLLETIYNLEKRKNYKIPITDDFSNIKESYLNTWITKNFPKRVVLTRINIRNMYFKEAFCRYDTSSLDEVRKIIKNVIFSRHKELFFEMEHKKNSRDSFE